jgi:hypothetical protein
MKMSTGNMLWINLFYVVALIAVATGQGMNYNVVDRSMESDSFRDMFVDKHNFFRRSVDPPASDMKKVIWCNDLEKIAIKRAQNCTVRSDVFGKFETSQFSFIGENTRFVDGSMTRVDALNTTVEEWFAEGDSYDYETNYCRESSCTSYKQLVHAKTWKVGCAYNYCDNVEGYDDFSSRHIVTCLYGEAGNVMYGLPNGGIASFRPYTKGTPCSNCQKNAQCNEGLCDDNMYVGTTAEPSGTTQSYQEQTTQAMNGEQMYNRDVKEWRYEFSRWRRGMERWEKEMEGYEDSTKECPEN